MFKLTKRANSNVSENNGNIDLKSIIFNFLSLKSSFRMFRFPKLLKQVNFFQYGLETD